MITHYLIFIILLLPCFLSLPRLRVNVESLCPDSLHFIENAYKNFIQLPEHDTIGSVDLIFFGKGSLIKENNVNLVKCQHGNRECLGNAALICLRETEKPKGINYEHAVISFFSNYQKNKTLEETLTFLKNDDFEQIIFNCAQQKMDSLLIKEMEQVYPQILSKQVPYYDLFINGQQKHEDSWFFDLQNDFVKLLCQESTAPYCKK